MDARCRACKIQGGPEEACVSTDDLTEITALTGRPCPRVELDPSLRLESRLLSVMLSEHGSALLGELVRATVPERDRAKMIHRLIAADDDRRVAVARRIVQDQILAERKR